MMFLDFAGLDGSLIVRTHAESAREALPAAPPILQVVRATQLQKAYEMAR